MTEVPRNQVDSPGTLIQLAESEQLDWRSPEVTALFTERMIQWRQSEGLERRPVEDGLEIGGILFEVISQDPQDLDQ
jgi:hypothetical protein